VIGGQFFDYQNYNNVPYFHGGLDLVAPAGTAIYTPVAGTVTISDYKITASNEPHTFSYARKPFRRGDSSQTRYLEVAIKTDAGLTWMFRHVNPASIPPQVFDYAETGLRVNKGQLIGRVAAWLEPVLPEKRIYDHLHLEILDTQGNYHNPAKYVKTGKDYYPPVLHNVFAARHGSTEAQILNSAAPIKVSGDLDLIVAVTDRMNEAAYQHALYSAIWSLDRLAADGTTEKIEYCEAFRFDILPFTGDRVQLSRVIYRDHLNTPTGKISANGSRGPRYFLVNITSGSLATGYSPENCLRTARYRNGLYRLQLQVADNAGNTRQQAFTLQIEN